MSRQQSAHRPRGEILANTIFALLMIGLIAFFIFGNFAPEHSRVHMTSDQPQPGQPSPAPVTR